MPGVIEVLPKEQSERTGSKIMETNTVINIMMRKEGNNINYIIKFNNYITLNLSIKSNFAE